MLTLDAGRITVPTMPLNYEIRVRGRVGDHLADALGLAAEVEPVETVLRGPVLDQQGLHRLLDRLQEMGIELVEVRQLPNLETGDALRDQLHPDDEQQDGDDGGAGGQG